MSPLQRTHKHLRESGMLVAKTEHWNHHAKCKQDLLGFADTLALNPTTTHDVVLIQSTTHDHHSHRVNKILATDHLPTILRHCRVEVWSWGLQGPRGQRKTVTLRRTGFTLLDQSAVRTFPSTDPFYL